MKILFASVENFASYKQLDFDFTNKGLTLVCGPTGSGKSTLLDVIPWIVFGKTAKGGAVDEIRSWNAEGDTVGYAKVEVQGKFIEIWRVRGDSNDLSYHFEGDTVRRGKDLADTQRQINALLGMDFDLYLSGAYFHEFSQTSQFFTAPAKIRRQIIEQMADLKLAKDLAEANSARKKEYKGLKEELSTQAATKNAHLVYLGKAIFSVEERREAWETARNHKVATLEKQKYNFESDKASRIREIKKEHLNKRVEMEYEIAELEREIKDVQYFEERHKVLATREALCGDTRCNECGALKDTDKRMILTKERYDLTREQDANENKKIQIKRLENSLKAHLEKLEPQVNEALSRTNTYADQIKALRREVNPHIETSESFIQSVKDTEASLKTVQEDIDTLAVEIADLDLLQTATDEFRAKLIENTVRELQSSINGMLEEHFDAELRVVLTIEDADKLNAQIYKDGNSAVFSQLSKGQRQLLKLTFGLSVMKVVANHHALSFNAIFLDEAFDGLSEHLKVKAFGLLQGLERQYESVFVVEHSQELRGLFDNRVEVSLINGESYIANM